MKDAILLELASRWEREADPQAGCGYPDTEGGHRLAGKHEGERETLRMCADTLRTLVDMLGDSK